MIEVWWIIGSENIAMYSEYFQSMIQINDGIPIMGMNCVVKNPGVGFSAFEANHCQFIHRRCLAWSMFFSEHLVQLIIGDKLNTPFP